MVKSSYLLDKQGLSLTKALARRRGILGATDGRTLVDRGKIPSTGFRFRLKLNNLLMKLQLKF